VLTNLGRYLDRLYATSHSRRDAVVEAFELFDRSATAGRTSEFYVKLRFWDGSLLQAEEALVVQAYAIIKTRYSYHYQGKDGSLIFRYDNAPHYPALAGFPEHKHDPSAVAPAAAPDLSQVLREIDAYLGEL
jgi:hypothetical protein